ncbi:hypothetical protein BC351_15780 [Paenibacillus ferrarius]|uniref:Nudix hydrolase domain-containing protein n=1 Tax=Paenibacillus ferrarius TaxID=1469647 RepID=A0A1V4HSS3_9BACL|nr:hypothetical protein [Paenibacillus ferrarius]OPH61389.1 hypothetical protein BC351_15780 [Paenibacillus ferrarius]
MSNKLMGAAAIILDSERRILLVKHSYGKNNWDLPGGKSDMHHFVFISNNENNQEPEPSSPEILECRYCSIDDLPKPISDFTYKRNRMLYSMIDSFYSTL